MRKRIIKPVQPDGDLPEDAWLDLDALAEVEVTSEDPANPIESALLPDEHAGWRAGDTGAQTIRLLFSEPQRLARIWLQFLESQADRTQEYVLRWSADGGESFHEIVRQQWNFSPLGATAEVEDHYVDLPTVTVLELIILPDIGGKPVTASLQAMRLA
ncbi:MAG: carbohydrate-binding protein [Sedimenticolaceae bacterium]